MNIKLLKSKMALCNIKYNDIAEATNVTKGAISQKMNGKLKFSIDDVGTISRLLNLNPSEICEIFLN